MNTALVPPDDSTEFWVNGDGDGNLNGFLGYSLSNVFQLALFSGGLYNNVPQTTPQARLYANDGAYNWRVGGKAVAFSPLRGAPFWEELASPSAATATSTPTQARATCSPKRWPPGKPTPSWR